ncbi:MAG: hypothetical protein KDA28_09720, partial [Phycisphaerales bacterium]|nr:hypothetical protein [Phycisphaerales bacterium]
AKYDPDTDTWSTMGSGMVRRIQTSVFDLDVDPSGVIYAGGQFESAGGDTNARNAARYTCDATCAADLNADGVLDIFDVLAYIAAFDAEDPSADMNGDGSFDIFDVLLYLRLFEEGC